MVIYDILICLKAWCLELFSVFYLLIKKSNISQPFKYFSFFFFLAIVNVLNGLLLSVYHAFSDLCFSKKHVSN